jgi:hypothetical protein
LKVKTSNAAGVQEFGNGAALGAAPLLPEHVMATGTTLCNTTFLYFFIEPLFGRKSKEISSKKTLGNQQ